MGKAARIVNEFTDVYLDYYKMVFSAVYTRIGNKEDTKDICQDIFLIFYEKFDEIENKRRWLFSTMRNVVLRYYQKKKETLIDAEEFFDNMGLVFVNGFRDTRIIIKEALDNIDHTEEEALIFDLVATSNYSYNEAAKEIGLTKRKVEYKYRQTVIKILDYLAKHNINNIEDLL